MKYINISYSSAVPLSVVQPNDKKTVFSLLSYKKFN